MNAKRNAEALRKKFVKHDGKYQLFDVEDDDGGDGAALGKLSAEQIGKGQEVLEQIKAALNGEGGNVAFLSGQFYSLIPTQTGRTAPPAIATMGKSSDSTSSSETVPGELGGEASPEPPVHDAADATS